MTEQLRSDGSLRHLLTLETLSRSQIERLLERSQSFVRPLGERPPRSDLLAGMTVANLFTEPYLLTGGGGPNGASASPVLLMYQRGIEQGQPDVAAAIGVLLASVVSGTFGVGAMAAFGMIPWAIFQTVFFGWVFGDIIVLATLGTVLTVILNPFIVKSKIYVRRFFS